MQLDLGVVIAAAVPSVFGFLLLRAIKAVDTSIEKLGTKVELLSAQDTRHSIELGELRVRLLEVERRLDRLEDRDATAPRRPEVTG